MAPEVGLGLPYNSSCDVYSFAVTLAQMLTCEKPYANFTTVRHIKESVWEPKSPSRPGLDKSSISDPLRVMLKQAWSANIALRPKVLEVKNFLLNEMRGQPFPKKTVEWLSTDNGCPCCQQNKARLAAGELRVLTDDRTADVEPAPFFIQEISSY